MNTQEEKFTLSERSMALHLSYEIGAAVLVLNNYHQFLAEKYEDPEFRASLALTLADCVQRLAWLGQQLDFFGRASERRDESFELGELISSAYLYARKLASSRSDSLELDGSDSPVMMTGERWALKHALTEVILNALQANPFDPVIHIRMVAGTPAAQDVSIEIRDRHASRRSKHTNREIKPPPPFISHTVVPPGFGLTVTRHIVETQHHGKLEVFPATAERAFFVRITLPLTQTR